MSEWIPTGSSSPGYRPHCRQQPHPSPLTRVSAVVKRRIYVAIFVTLVVMALSLLFIYGTPDLPNEHCRSEGEACMKHAECCARNCKDRICQSGIPPWNPSCLSLGNLCETDFECCTSNCQQGHCASYQPPWTAGECRSTGESCEGNVECCSMNCKDGVCKEFELDCRAVKNSCTNDEECCSFICKGSSCVDCVENELSCDRDEECCSFSCREGLCKSCLHYGETCKADDECCSSKCVDHYCEMDGVYEEEYHSEYENRHPLIPDDDATVKGPYNGPKPGFVYRTGPQGMGYYPEDITDDNELHP